MQRKERACGVRAIVSVLRLRASVYMRVRVQIHHGSGVRGHFDEARESEGDVTVRGVIIRRNRNVRRDEEHQSRPEDPVRRPQHRHEHRDTEKRMKRDMQQFVSSLTMPE